MKIAVAGTGYVGLFIAVLLAQRYEVTAVDILPDRVDMINRRQSPIADEEIEAYLRKPDLRRFSGSMQQKTSQNLRTQAPRIQH